MLLICCCSMFVHAQNTNSKFVDIIAGLDSLQAVSPIEKAHLHIDKPFYSVGDTIWIKAYVTTQNNQLSALSRLLHVELINDDSVKTHLVMPITNGQAWGAITLYDTLYRTGNYTLRAYTNVMRNFDDDYFFNRQIAIGNALPKTAQILDSPALSPSLVATATSAASDNDISLSFFPEGGNLISNIAAVVAFKAIGKDGLSRNVNGYIVDEQGNKVTTFTSEHAGMGTFKLFAKPGSSFTAVYGAEKRVALPAIQPEGYSMAISQNKDNVLLKIISSAGISDGDAITIVAQANNEVLYTAKAALKAHGLITAIKKSRFAGGIVQFTLFDKNFSPVAERLIFVNHPEGNIRLVLTDAEADSKKPDTKRYKLTAVYGDGKPVSGAFSMAVTSATKVAYDENNEVTILSGLLLTSNLKGHIEQPNYYFTDTSALKRKQLDNLLLTQGWRRFIWQDVMAGNFKTNLRAPEQGDVAGIVTDEQQRPVAGARVNLLIKGKDGALLDTISDANGKFTFKEVFLSRDDDFIISATDKKGKAKYNIRADEVNLHRPPKISAAPLIPYPGFDAYIENAGKDYKELQSLGLLNSTGEILSEVKVSESKLPALKDQALKHSANLMGKGKANQVITFLDLIPCRGINELYGCLLSIGKLNNITYFKERFYARQSIDQLTTSVPMAVIINGTPANPDLPTPSIAMSEIASIEIVRSTSLSAIYGSRGGGGSIIITTKTGDVDYDAYERAYLGVENNKKGKLKLSSTSFAPRREFYTPVYNAQNTAETDLRSTIYWQPNIITDDNGTAVIEFAPGKAPYRIIMEGVGLNGQPGRTVINSN